MLVELEGGLVARIKHSKALGWYAEILKGASLIARLAPDKPTKEAAIQAAKEWVPPRKET